MLHYNLIAVKGEDAVSAVMSVASILELAYCGLRMDAFYGSQLVKDGLDPEGIRTGAMEMVGACSEMLSYLVGEDLLEGAE